MDFLIGYAGVPTEDWNIIVKSKNRIAGEATKIYARPFGKGQTSYYRGYELPFIEQFAKEYKGNLRVRRELGMAIVYVDNDTSQSNILVSSLMPSLMATPARWNPVRGDSREVANSRNALIESLTAATLRAKRTLQVLRDELILRANRTPLLLPVRNFDEHGVTNCLLDIQESLARCEDPAGCLRSKVNEYTAIFAQAIEKTGTVHRRYFQNGQNIWFVAPGNALHGEFHPVVKGHPDACILRSFNRLGAPYKPGFHYDCKRPTQSILKGDFFKCHLDRSPATGVPHLNIAPNDAVRPER